MELILMFTAMAILGIALRATSKNGNENLNKTTVSNIVMSPEEERQNENDVVSVVQRLKNSIKNMIKEIEPERGNMRRLEKRFRWAKNRLVNYPNCHIGKKFKALDILAEICRLEAKFPGMKKDLKNRAEQILDIVVQSRGKKSRKIREQAEVILNCSKIIATVTQDDFEPVQEASVKDDELQFVEPLKLAA